MRRNLLNLRFCYSTRILADRRCSRMTPRWALYLSLWHPRVFTICDLPSAFARCYSRGTAWRETNAWSVTLRLAAVKTASYAQKGEVCNMSIPVNGPSGVHTRCTRTIARFSRNNSGTSVIRPYSRSARISLDLRSLKINNFWISLYGLVSSLNSPC